MAASILIVDDDAVARRLVENMVQKCGYETVVVESGDAAIAMLTAPDAPALDAVVLDLVMPGLDGMGVLAKIREASLNIPVIVQTAHGGIDNVVSAMRAGAQDFVVKPVGIERLQVSLRNALNATRGAAAQIARIIDLRRPYGKPFWVGRNTARQFGAGRRRIRRRNCSRAPSMAAAAANQTVRCGQLRRDPG
jgi:DNA-binding NtrC family response regulator